MRKIGAVELAGAKDSKDNDIGMVGIADAAILAADWTGAGIGNAPDPELYAPRQIGCDLAGIETGLTYHIIGAVGSKAWVATGGTVKNLYGGA
jgi:hypothetical protein